MCILCIASRWSRHIAAMVMPMVTLWALSQFLPQGFRFEINSPKLACVGVLFVSLSWFELVMPRLSAWRARRTAALKERRRVEAQEAAKRRKKAIRRCRNCFTAYKDQTPASGRFMCTFCGHVSKRPVLDLPVGASKSRSSFSLPVSAVEFLSGSGFFPVTVSPKYWYDRASFVRPSWGSGISWIGVGPWMDGASWGMSTSWFGGSWPGSALYFGNTGFGWPGSAGTLLGDGVFGGERWFAGESYSGFIWFILRVFSQSLVFAVWIWRKLSRAEYAEENGVDEDHEVDGDHEVCHTRAVIGGSSYEAKDKKARRKAEEKRLARLEKENQEAEEKKQREEVARLVEERSRQRVKKLGLDKRNTPKFGKEAKVYKNCEKREEKFHGKEKVFSANENIVEQDIEDLTRKANSVAAKSTKPSKNTGIKEKEGNAKAASTFFSKWSAFKSQGSSKSRLFNHSKNVAAFSKSSASSSSDLNSPLKPCKKSGPSNYPVPSASNSSAKLSDVCTTVPGSAWAQTPWADVVCHGVSEASTNSSKDTDIIQSIHQEVNSINSAASINPVGYENISDVMDDISLQQFRTAAVPFGRTQVNHSNDGECSRSEDLSLCQYSERAGTNPSLVCNSGSSISQSAQRSVSNRTIDVFDMCTSDPSASVARPPVANNFAGMTTQNPRFFSSSERSAVVMHETGTSSFSPLIIESWPASVILESRSSHQTWEPRSIPVNDIGGLSLEKWHPCSLICPSNINTLPVDASFQERDDLYQQTTVEPEFYLPSSLLSVEENDSHHCFLEDRMFRKKRCAEIDGMEYAWCEWEDLDVHCRVPPEFVDCITHSLMEDPVITADGHSYERSAIEDWLKLHDTSPKTGEVLPPPPGGKGVDKTLRPNHILRCQIIEFRECVMQRRYDELPISVCGIESGRSKRPFKSSPFQPLPNNLFPVQAVWPRGTFGE